MKSKNYPIVIALVFLVALIIGVILINRDRRPSLVNDNPDPTALTDCEKFAASIKNYSEKYAIDAINKQGRPYRVVMRDGVGAVVADDYSPSRINLTIVGDKIISASCQ